MRAEIEREVRAKIAAEQAEQAKQAASTGSNEKYEKASDEKADSQS